MKRVLCLTMLLMLVMFGVSFATQPQGYGDSSATATATGGSVVDNSHTTNNNVNTPIANGGDATIQKGAISNDVDVNNSVRSNQDQYQSQSLKSTQVGIQENNQKSNQKNNQSNSQVTNDEHKKFESFGVAFPSVTSAEGTNSASASYFLGSLGKSNTETYKKVIPEIQTILAIPEDVLPLAMKKDIISTLLKKMSDANRTQRFLGILWEDNSKNLINMFGLLTMDSFWDEGQRPFQCKSDMMATAPALETNIPVTPAATKEAAPVSEGNKGYVGH